MGSSFSVNFGCRIEREEWLFVKVECMFTNKNQNMQIDFSPKSSSYK